MDNLINNLHLHEYFLLRTAGTSLCDTKALCFQRTVQILKELAESERQLNITSSILCEKIFSQVTKSEEYPKLQKLLINAKRTVFHLKRIRQYNAIQEGLLAASSPLLGDIDEWQTKILNHQKLNDDVEKVLSSELEDKRSVLRQLFTNQDFQRGLLLSSSHIFNACQSYIRSEKNNKKNRKAEHKLLMYLFRSTFKTSPFSTFCTVNLGAWETGQNAWDQAPTFHKSSKCLLNVAILEQIRLACLRHPTTQDRRLISLNRTLTMDKRFFYFVRVSNASILKRGNLKENDFFKIRRTDTCDWIYNYLRTECKEGYLRYSDLVDRISRSFPSQNRDEIHDSIGKLLHLDFLTNFDINTQWLDQPICYLQETVKDLQPSGWQDVVGFLQQAEQCQQDFENADISKRRELLKQITTLFQSCLDHFANKNKEKDSNEAEKQDDADTLEKVLYEDTTLENGCFKLDPGIILRNQADLGRAILLSILYDRELSDLLLMSAFFQDRFPEEKAVPFLEFYKCYYKEFFLEHKRTTQFSINEIPNHFDHPTISLLNDLNSSFIQYISEREARGSKVIHLQRDFLDSLIERLPPALKHSRSKSIFFQKAQELLVINHIYPGLGNVFTRFSPLLKNQGPICSHVKHLLDNSLKERGFTYAELVAHLGTNLNIHENLCSTSVLMPSENPSPAFSRNIDLCMETEVFLQGGLLHLRELETKIPLKPIYLGYLFPLFLTDMYKVISSFSENTYSELALGSEGKQYQCEGTSITEHARVQLGNLVLRRRRWTIDASSIPQQQTKDSQSSFFAIFRRFFNDRHLPAQSFYKFHFSEDSMEQDPENAKPNFLNLDDFFSVLVFSRELKGNQAVEVSFSESLPKLEDAFIESARGPFVTEIVAELTVEALDG